MTEWCGCHALYGQYKGAIDLFIEQARKGNVDNTHAALFIMAMHKESGLLVEQEDDGTKSSVVLDVMGFVKYVVRKNLVVTFHVTERGARGPKIAMGLIPFLEGHMAASSWDIEARPSSLPSVLKVDKWTHRPGRDPAVPSIWYDGGARVRVPGVLEILIAAIEANAKHTFLVAGILPVPLVPELVAEYARMGGDDVLRKVLSRIPRQRTILHYFKKRKRDN